MAASDFKVLVVGGGPVGLIAAHALHHAGIDFEVLEARDSVVLDQGASLVLASPSIRVLHQLGLWERLSEIGVEMKRSTSFTRDGSIFSDNTALFQTFKTNFGLAPYIFHRAQLINVLYNELPSDAKVHYHLSKKIMSMDVSKKDSVQVTCTDGSTFEGSIVLGADGVHSKTRTLMRGLALSQDTQLTWEDAAEPFSKEYRCLWSSFPRPAEVEQGYATDTQSKDMSVMFLAGKERGWIFLYKRIEPSEASTSPKRPEKATRIRWTEDDMRTYATQFAEFPVTETLNVKDVYETRFNQGLADLEEGILKRWSWGRVVLAGDACHKFTPNAGRGLNNGIQDVVALCNGLYEMLNSKQGISPDEATLSKVFSEYQTLRSEPLKSDYKQSRSISRMHAWKNTLYYFMARYIMSCEWLVMFMLKFSASKMIKKAFVFNYILVDEPFTALVKWNHPLVADADLQK